MQKQQFFSVVLIFFAGCFVCEAQPGIGVRKAGTLFTSTSSGGGAGAICDLSMAIR